MDYIALSLIVVFLLLSSGFFSASETALFSLPSTRIRAYRNSTNPRRKLIANLVLKPRDLLVTVFMLNTLVNILLQNAISHLSGPSHNWTLKIVVPFVLMLFLGEIIPKYIGLQNNIQFADLFAPSINYMQKLLTPIRTIIISITAPISRMMFFFLRKETSISKEELKHVLKTSQEHGVLDHNENELIWGYLNLQDASVKQLMRPREDILYYDINDPLTKLIHLFVDEECSRLPVCDKSIDNVLGIIDASHYFLHRDNIQKGNDIIKYLQKPLYVPETTPARTLIKQFEEMKTVMSLVVDEYGSITGLITHEDLVEQVIGEIADRRDTDSLYVKAGVNEIIASGRLELSEFNEIFNSNLESKNNLITIGGWLIEQLDDIPKSGMKFELQQFLFQILAADPNKIRRLYIRKLGNSSKKPSKKSKTNE